MNKVVSLLLVLYPLLHIYCLPGFKLFPVSYLIFGLLLIVIILNKKFKLNCKLPSGFKLYWIYVSIIYVVLAKKFGIGLFIPGGYSFFMWIVLFWLCNTYLDYDSFKKYYRIVFTICSVVFLIQEFLYFTTGSRPLFMLPLPFYGVDKAIILMNQTALDRSSCFFIEPSHFAQFSIPLLAIELFDRSKDKIINYFSVFIIAILLLLRSGNGMLGILLLLTIRTVTYFRYSHSNHKFLVYLLFVPIAAFCTYKYVGTEIGSGMIERASGVGFSEDAESATRIVKGFLLYSELPILNKIFGYHIDDIANFAFSSKISYIFINKATNEDELYLNGFQQVLVVNGLIGIILFVRVWLKLFFRNSILAKSLVGVYLFLSFVSNLYLNQMMLICMLLPFKFKTDKQFLYENES